MYHKVHLGDDTHCRIEPAKLQVVVTDQPLDVCGIIIRDPWREQAINDVHHQNEVFPPLIVTRNVVPYEKGQDASEKSHLGSYKQKERRGRGRGEEACQK